MTTGWHDARYKLHGKSYRLLWRQLKANQSAWCTDPSLPKRTIVMHRGGPRRSRLRVLEELIHEMLHACAWDMSEQWVQETAADIARVLWSQGYRYTPDHKEGD